MENTKIWTDSSGTKWVTRVGECVQCEEIFTHTRRHPAVGRWPSSHPDCAARRAKAANRERMRANRAGERTPAYRAEAPLWNPSDHEGPGARRAISNSQAQALTRRAEAHMDGQPSPKGPKLSRTDYVGTGTPEVKSKKAPVPTGDEGVDALKRVLVVQEDDRTWRSSLGPAEGFTNPDIPVRELDEESRQWLEENLAWFRTEKTEDGGWGVEPSRSPSSLREFSRLAYSSDFIDIGKYTDNPDLALALDVAYHEWQEEGSGDLEVLSKVWREIVKEHQK